MGRILCGGLLALIAVNAFGGATYGLLGAREIPTSWLEGSPFKDYFFPSLILGVVVGGSCALAGLAVFRRWRRARVFSLAAALIVLGWIVTQVALIGFVSWLQPVTAAAGLIILGLAVLVEFPHS